MASNKEKQLVEKDEDNLQEEILSKSNSIETENKLKINFMKLVGFKP